MKIFLKTLALVLNLSYAWGWPRSQKPVAEVVWREHCVRNGLALNDCNWCHCDSKLQYTCTARICDHVDMFGHFNDAIKEVDVGMEGKGVWRSMDTACEPGVHYRKKELLCVCTEEGKWPNPVCRDVFQVLHAVEPTDHETPSNQTCSPNKLYQIGCNVCYCPSNGFVNLTLCTKRNCTNDVADPVEPAKTATHEPVEEVYAACERAKKYQLDCQNCICLPNNRLLCDNCTSVNNITTKMQLKPTSNLCWGKVPNKRFIRDCNICYCDQKEIIYCSVYNCLTFNMNVMLPGKNFELVNTPIDDNDCVPGTKYKRDCNLCYCFMQHGVKYFGCTINSCGQETPINEPSGCVVGTSYEKNCLICQCFKRDGQKMELCFYNEKCRDARANTIGIEYTVDNNKSLSSMHGYCEPLHTYQHDCNKCKCLTDGKTVACTSKQCSKVDKSMVIEFIPFIQKNNVCPKGHKYKVDCNVCHCMSNGNALCTTISCKSNNKT